MRAEITQCGNRPQLEFCGEITKLRFSDGDSRADVFLTATQARQMAAEILDLPESNVHPLFARILEGIAP